MRRAAHFFAGCFRQPVLIWRAIQFAAVLKPSALFQVKRRPEANYRAIVVGLDQKYWTCFDAAYPEFDKLFAEKDILIAELRLALLAKHVALIVFPDFPRRRVEAAARRLQTVVFEATAAPIPVLERKGELAFGFSLDSAGQWLSPRRTTEFSLILETFDLANRPAFCAEASALTERFALPKAVSPRQLIVANSNIADAEVPGLTRIDSPPDASDPDALVFNDHLYADWWEPEVQSAFVEALRRCDSVIVHDSPLGLLAVLAGRDVFVTGKPVWAGFGLTRESSFIHRARTLTRAELTGMILLVLSRYVDESGNPVDPMDDWSLPGESPASLDETALPHPPETKAATEPPALTSSDE